MGSDDLHKHIENILGSLSNLKCCSRNVCYRKFGDVDEGRIGTVENKLLSFPTVQGIVFGSFDEASEAVWWRLLPPAGLDWLRFRGGGRVWSGQRRGRSLLPCPSSGGHCHQSSVTLIAGQDGGLGEGGDGSNGEKE
jgi:hypothetical protein